MNILIWHNPTKKYITMNGRLPIDYPNKIFIPKLSDITLYGITPPQYLIYESIFYKQASFNSKYQPTIAYISILDGYVNFDKNFEKNIVLN